MRSAARDRDALRSLLATEEMSDDDVERACALLERLGAKEEGERAALAHGEAAIGSLDQIALHSERRQELELLARFAAQRRS